MSVYSIGFAKEFLKLARVEYEHENLDPKYNRVLDSKDVDAIRTVIYLCLLSCEISLKALLEKVGMPVKKIRACSHDLNLLKDMVGFCEVEDEVAPELPGLKTWGSAFNLFCEPIQQLYEGKMIAPTTVGELFEGLSKTSKYPDEIRYNEKMLRHYPPEVVLKMATSILSKAEEYWDRIRKVKATEEGWERRRKEHQHKK